MSSDKRRCRHVCQHGHPIVLPQVCRLQLACTLCCFCDRRTLYFVFCSYNFCLPMTFRIYSTAIITLALAAVNAQYARQRWRRQQQRTGGADSNGVNIQYRCASCKLVCRLAHGRCTALCRTATNCYCRVSATIATSKHSLSKDSSSFFYQVQQSTTASRPLVYVAQQSHNGTTYFTPATLQPQVMYAPQYAPPPHAYYDVQVINTIERMQENEQEDLCTPIPVRNR